MPSFLWFGMRRAKRKYTTRSGFEQKVVQYLEKQKVDFGYESVKIVFVQPEVTRKYTPDFEIKSNGLLIEAKGRFTAIDRKKMQFVKASNPDLRIVMLFQDSQKPIRKGSKTRYCDWCDKAGIEWADFRNGIPKDWLECK